MRSVNRLGWGAAAVSGGVTPAELTTAYPYKQKWFPAAVMNAQVNDHEAVFCARPIAAQNQAYDCWCFPEWSGGHGVVWTWGIKAFEMDVVDPQIKMLPIWFQYDDATAPDPTEFVDWEFAVGNAGYDYDLNFVLHNGEVKKSSPVLDQWHLSGGYSGNGENTWAGMTLQGEALNASDFNLLQFSLIRGGSVDTWDDSAALIGVIVQYKTNFENIAVWPSA